jgi:hypothetical protein
VWDVFANQSENFDSFASHSLLSLLIPKNFEFKTKSAFTNSSKRIEITTTPSILRPIPALSS